MKDKRDAYINNGSVISVAYAAMEDAMPDSRLMLLKDVEKVLRSKKEIGYIKADSSIDILITELHTLKLIDINGKWVYIEKW